MSCTQVQATVPVFDPVNYVQNVLNQANTLKATINQTKQIAYQLQQIELQVRALRNIPKGQWGAIQSEMARLRQIMRNSQTISYADQNLSNEFDKMYPGFQGAPDFVQQYKEWARNSLAGIKASLQDAHVQDRQLGSEDELLYSLESMSDGAAGHMQVLQVGNMIAAQQVQQLQKLRQLQMAQIQTQASFLAAQQQIQTSQYASLRAWIDSASNPAVKF